MCDINKIINEKRKNIFKINRIIYTTAEKKHIFGRVTCKSYIKYEKKDFFSRINGMICEIIWKHTTCTVNILFKFCLT